MKSFIFFIAGAAVGAAAAWFITSKKYEKIAQDEIDSVKKQFEKERDMIRDILNNKPPVDEYVKTIEDEGYSEVKKSGHYPWGKGEVSDYIMDKEKPYIISQEEFCEYDDYNRFTMNYYSNGVLVDAEDPDIPIDDINDIVGYDNLQEGEEEDWIYVRNDRLKSDYEIYFDPEPFFPEE